MVLVQSRGRSGRTTLKDINWESGPDRKLAHNTYRITVSEFDETGERIYLPGVRFHSTNIITKSWDDNYRLNSGGWQTSTTKQRLNALLPGFIYVWQKNFVWYVSTKNGDIPFEDNMIVSL